ncbi:MAG: DUF3341 domain-containing protein [Acidobacteria bacterium]|nr:DUF3341 domain-containing protein [Acidobacteriota bacterium]MBI3280348.1 DUF3341 domain-containing protein [Acidobacteriota bacterium]
MHTNTPELRDKNIWGMVAEFERPRDLVEAGRRVHHEHGYKKLDALSPFPIHGIDAAIGVPRSMLGYVVFAMGILGCAGAALMIWFMNGADYPLVIGGKPLFAFEPSIPVMFEVTVLFAALTAFAGMFALNGLPRLYHPAFNYSRFGAATDDRYLLVVEAADPKFDIDETRRLLESLGARHVEVIEG